MRPPRPRPIRVYHRPGRSRPLIYLETVHHCTLHQAIACYAAQSLAYDVRDLRAFFA